MRIEDLVYRVAGEALALLEKKYHYKIAEDHKKDIQNSIRKNLNQYIAQASEPADD
ncbi:hypothetical protein HQ576_00705 [bacterium]|nr:hypothetical protein [bacterium]